MTKSKVFWWNGADLKPFLDDLASRDLADVRVEFNAETGLLHIVNVTAAVGTLEGGEGGGGGGYNFVHTCPPDCS